MPRLPDPAVRAGFVALLSAGLAIAPQSAARASVGLDATYTIGYTTGMGAYPRSEPRYEARVGTALPEGATISARCWTTGESITNPYNYTSAVWIQTSDGLYFPEVWVETGGWGVPAGLPECNAQPITTSPTLPNDFFNRDATVAWALQHAQDAGDRIVPGCAWFASQALWAGGFPQDGTWSASGDHPAWVNGMYRVPGSLTAWGVSDLATYLTQHFDISRLPMDFAGNAVPEAAPGDLVLYDWEGDGVPDHFAVITGIAEGSYPLVTEWGVGDFFNPATRYVQRGWTYSEKDSDWLQVGNPGVTATLYHFNGGYYLAQY